MSLPRDEMMKQKTLRFLRNECGAVTVDWVVLTGAVAALVMVVFSIIQQGSYQAAAVGIAGGVAQAVNIGSTP
jgi:Flp pilus assembly pilin Flp